MRANMIIISAGRWVFIKDDELFMAVCMSHQHNEDDKILLF
jgi:hypothetical protein